MHALMGRLMFTKLNTDPNKSPRLLGELDLSHAQVSSTEFRYLKGTKIFGETEPADHIYQVVEGAVRSHKLLSDGRRQIGAFHLRGDIFGLENGDFHRFTAEAIVDTTVRLVKRQSLERVAKTDPAMVRSPPDHDNRQSSACREPHAPFGTQELARTRRSVSP